MWPKNKFGFTFLECLINIGLLNILLAVLFPVLILFYQEYGITLNQHQRWLTKFFVQDHFLTVIRNATQRLPNSSANQLCLLNNDTPAKEVKIEMINQRIRQKLGRSYQYLTNAGEVDDLYFHYAGKQVFYRVSFSDGSVLSQNVCLRN